MLLHIHHETRLTYSEPVTETVLEVRMAPPSDEDQTNLGYRLRITPQPPVAAYRDGFGNRVDLFNVLAPHRELVIHATSIVRIHRRPGAGRLAEASWPCEGVVPVDAIEYLQPSPLVDKSRDLSALVASFAEPTGSLLDLVRKVTEAVRARLKYEARATTAWTPLSEALVLGKGVCQDFAHLFLGICRGLGMPARYVSGYIDEPGELATHAWCQVWDGRTGWVDVDPTRGAFVADGYVVIAVGRDYSDVPPNRGVWKGMADETIAVAVKVERLERMPPDWSDWGVQAPWLGSSWTRYQGQAQRSGINGRHVYRQQQSQQQQA